MENLKKKIQGKKLNEDVLIFNNFGINEEAFDVHDPDSDCDILDDSISCTTVAGSLVSEETIVDYNKNNEIQPFVWDELAFEQAQILANKKENDDDDEIEWEDLEYESSETASFATESIEDEGLNYLLDNCENNQILTPCVLLHIADGQIQRCSNYKQKSQRPLAQLVGTWEIDSEAFKSVKNDNRIYTLGVCGSHFTFDQNELHNSNLKNLQCIKKSCINYHRCLFCNKDKYFFSRGASCVQHSIDVIGRNIQVPCMGLKTCSAFNNIEKSNFNNINNKYQPRYICTQCFNSQGGHFFQRPGSGKKPSSCNDKHENDTTQALELLGQFILNMAASNKSEQKKELLTYLGSILPFFDKTKSHIKNPPSLLFIKTALRLGQVNITKIIENDHNFTPEIAKKNGEMLGISVWKSQHEIQQNKEALEKPNSLVEYQAAFPHCILNFFNGLITKLQKRKHDIVNKKRKQRGLEIKAFDEARVNKISIFFVSVILSIAFPATDIWLTHVMSSLARKSKLLTSLYSILCTAGVISHTQRYERKLEQCRMIKTNPVQRLVKGENIWNVSVIDNIDFKESSFKYGNIFDDTRGTSHATLRVVFQFTLPISLNSLKYATTNEQISNNTVYNNNNNTDCILFGESDFIKSQYYKQETVFSKLMEQFSNNWDIDDIYNELVKDVPLGCQVLATNFVILAPGEQPNCDLNVYNSCEMYFKDLQLSENEHLDIASDDAIFRRLISYRESKKDKSVRLLLGQWHTSKAMCATIITIFSGYGIFNLAAELGVKYLDKLEKVVDYNATFHVLELIWMAVGIALMKYLKNRNKNETIYDIEKENNIVKVWILYFRWMGLVISHKIGIRHGNYDLQFHSLSAFSPLFIAVGKSNYARSTTHFLDQISKDSSLQKLLHYACSVNLTRPGHYLAFDEALEVFGVKFVKQNIKPNIMDNEQLKLQISSVQSERDRIKVLLSEYVDDIIVNNNDRKIQPRKESIWKLAENLTIAFQLSNPTDNELFKNTKEINKVGFLHISTCYLQGIKRLNSIYRQEILKTEERVVKGRREHNVNTYKLTSLLIDTDKKRKKNINVKDNDINYNNEKTPPTKRIRRSTSNKAKEILSQLLTYKSFVEDDQLLYKVLHELQDIESGWDKDRVMTYWRNHHNK